jgi:hypothetical protein
MLPLPLHPRRYTVALSADLTYCAYGGTNKAVVVLDGKTGVQV